MNCTGIAPDAASSLAGTLRSVDCAAGQATAFAFDRLFGDHGTLTLALTALLTLYVALLAFNLLTGRSSLSLSLLTPRALTLGLVLTFATSWAAYEHVVWNLAVGAPDQVASLLIGSKGSATSLFAQRLDGVFAAITDVAGADGPVKEAAKSASALSPPELLWLSALLFLLGSAGVLLTARIALAALLAVGPVFIVLAMFESTRGLFEGWLKCVALFAIVPMLTVLTGGGALLLMAPIIRSLSTSALTMHLAASLFLGSCVYVALMALALKTAAVLTNGWRLPGGRSEHGSASSAVPALQFPAASAATDVPQYARSERIRQIVLAANTPGATNVLPGTARATFTSASFTSSQVGSRERTRGIGGDLGRKKRTAP